MFTRTLSKLNRPNFLGIGVSADAVKTIQICNERKSMKGIYGDIGIINLGISSNILVNRDLGEIICEADLKIVVHLEEFNICTEYEEQRLDKLMAQNACLAPLWLEQDIGIWVAGRMKLGPHMLNPILSEESLEITIANVRKLTRQAGIQFLAENPPIYLNIEEIDLLNFMSRLADATGCGLVLDIGHYIGYCLTTNREPSTYLKRWIGIEHVREIHVAGFEVFQTGSRIIWLDKHSALIPASGIKLLQEAFIRAPNVQVVTLEQDGASIEVERENIHAVINALEILHETRL